MKNTQEIQYWEDIEHAKYYIIDPRYYTQSTEWRKNGSFQNKFDPSVSGTAGILERK